MRPQRPQRRILPQRQITINQPNTRHIPWHTQSLHCRLQFSSLRPTAKTKHNAVIRRLQFTRPSVCSFPIPTRSSGMEASPLPVPRQLGKYSCRDPDLRSTNRLQRHGAHPYHSQSQNRGSRHDHKQALRRPLSQPGSTSLEAQVYLSAWPDTKTRWRMAPHPRLILAPWTGHQPGYSR